MCPHQRHQHFLTIICPNKTAKRQNRKLLEVTSMTARFCILKTKSRMKVKVCKLYSSEWRTSKDKPCSSLTHFTKAKAKKETSLQYLSQCAARQSAGDKVKALSTKETSTASGMMAGPLKALHQPGDFS